MSSTSISSLDLTPTFSTSSTSCCIVNHVYVFYLHLFTWSHTYILHLLYLLLPCISPSMSSTSTNLLYLLLPPSNFLYLLLHCPISVSSTSISLHDFHDFLLLHLLFRPYLPPATRLYPLYPYLLSLPATRTSIYLLDFLYTSPYPTNSSTALVIPPFPQSSFFYLLYILLEYWTLDLLCILLSTVCTCNNFFFLTDFPIRYSFLSVSRKILASQ